ncbi:MAG: signal peptide peptidase SppA [Nitrospinae bacterium]|nr:signal peptide peptidase SppA [Nitrospinota bacterium]
MRDLRLKSWGLFLWIACLLSGCAFVSVSLQEKVRPLEETVLSGEGKDKVLLISIGGVIGGVEPTPLRLVRPSRRPDMLSEVKEQLEKASDDHRVKALILRINSPGGGVTASDTLFHEVMELKRKTNAKVVASIQDIGTSGAYYIALAGDKIVAHPTAITGSIGVLTLRFNAQKLLEKIGVDASVIQSGKRKDVGLPFRPLSSEEREMLQGIVNNFYERFVGLVVERRKKGISLEQARKIADGRILGSKEAKELGLIDEVGYLDEAIDLAKKEAGLQKARVVAYHRPGEYLNNIYSMAPGGGMEKMAPWGGFRGVDLLGQGPPSLSGAPIPGLEDILGDPGPTFLYLWMP